MTTSPATPRSVLAALILIGALVGGFGATSLVRMQAETATGEIVTGRVVSYDVSKPTTSGGWSRYPVVVFETRSGQSVRAKARTSSDARIGTDVRVLYQPNRPDRPHLPDATAYLLVPLAAAWVGAFGVLFGVLIWRRVGRPYGAG